MKFNGLLCIVCSIICAAFIGSSDAAVTGWTTPDSSGAADVSDTITVDENEATVATLVCTVDGTGASSEYEIVDQPSSNTFEVGAGSGALTVVTGQTLDYEATSSYIIKVTCTDSVDADVGTATLTISLNDLNEAPEFASPQYSLTIPDGSTAGTTLTTVTATDQDNADVITYSILPASDPNTDFDVSSSGVITVSTGTTLTRSTTGGYGLVVHAVDDNGTPLTGSTTVYVVVKTCGASVAMVGIMTLVLVAVSMLV